MRSEPQREALFEMAPSEGSAAADSAGAPLPARMRPRTLDEFVGQASLVGPGTLLRQALEEDRLTSAIVWGPPGSGKSTLASIIAGTTRGAFENFSAVTSGVADLRKVIDRARERRKKLGQRTILFVDEIHRWNKSQQDALLPHVEDGTVVLIGATTENPSFEVNAPLISRSRIFRFDRLTDQHVYGLLQRALADSERGLGGRNVEVDEEALRHLADIAGGDARTALGALETAVEQAPESGGVRRVTRETAEEAAQQRALKYDKQSDEHYDTISAFIKSVRGSDADAALYWLAKMLEAGEDPRFIARRLVILASEDIGNADPMGLVLANAAAQAVMFIGLPEGQLTLAQATTYLATAPKSNRSMIGISRALEDIREKGAAPVPMHLRDTHYPASKKLGHGKEYVYPHDFPGHYVEQEYAPESARSGPYYEPSDQGYERAIREMAEERRLTAVEADSQDAES